MQKNFMVIEISNQEVFCTIKCKQDELFCFAKPVLEVGLDFFATQKSLPFLLARNIANKFSIFSRFVVRSNLRFSSHLTMSENKIRPFGSILFSGAGSRTRTYEGRSREIYSLLSLPLDDSSRSL